MTISPSFVTRFIKLIMGRRFSEAERVIKRLRNNVEKNEWNKGYLQALNGMLLAQRSSDDRYVFLQNINPNDRKEVRKFRREFLGHTKNGLNTDYDRGFFSAWAEYMRILLMKLKEATK